MERNGGYCGGMNVVKGVVERRIREVDVDVDVDVEMEEVGKLKPSLPGHSQHEQPRVWGI